MPIATLAVAPAPTPTIPANAARVPLALAGSTVSVHYHGTLDDGEVFDSSLEGAPLTFTVATGQMIPGFDAVVLGMALGEKSTIRIPPEEAYGQRFDELVVEVPRESIPPEAVVGQRLFSTTGGSIIVTAIGAATATIDGNHPLAGKALTFEIEIVEIN